MRLRGFAHPSRRFNIMTTPAVAIEVRRVFGPFYRIYAIAPDGAEQRAGWAFGHNSADTFALLLGLAREGVMARGNRE